MNEWMELWRMNVVFDGALEAYVYAGKGRKMGLQEKGEGGLKCT